jgi:hypothetical protein
MNATARKIEPGMKFFKLTVLEREQNRKPTHRLYNFQAKSCGCDWQNRVRGPGSKGWKGHGEISSVYFGFIKRSAKNRGIEFRVTIEEIWDLFVAQDRKCAITGLPISVAQHKGADKDELRSASLDRKESDKPYEIGNVWWVDKRINLMKRSSSMAEFVSWCQKIAEGCDRNFIHPEILPAVFEDGPTFTT